MQSTKLSFEILNTNSCKTLGIYDLSYYNPSQTISNRTLQIITPYDDTPVELDYYHNALTVFNSNTLNITNVNDLSFLTELPDGLYTAKMSICPEDKFFFEKSWYRTCILQCKYDKAFLKLSVQDCQACFSPQKLESLKRAKIYMMSAKVQADNCNFKEADKMYKASSKLLDKINDCDC